MKAKPVKLEGFSWVGCPIEEMTHVQIHIPSPALIQTLPVITKGSRDGTPCWTWNGSVDKPTLKPSVLVSGYCYDTGKDFSCHTWITDGKAKFLGDCTHDSANTVQDLLDVV